MVALELGMREPQNIAQGNLKEDDKKEERRRKPRSPCPGCAHQDYFSELAIDSRIDARALDNMGPMLFSGILSRLAISR